MRPATVFKKFNQTISLWKNGLDNYILQQLLKKPDDESWSLGQVYVHLIDNTLHYNIEQIEICISSNRNAKGIKSREGEMVYLRNALPPVKLKAPEIDQPKQPESIPQIKKEVNRIKKLMTRLEKRIMSSPYKGKTKHPGLHYLNALEWFQFIEMHFRHHLRQKKRIDMYLDSIK